MHAFLHPEEWAARFFNTLRMFGGSTIEQTLTQAHSTKEGTYIIHMIK